MSISSTRGRQFVAIGLAAVSLTLGGCAAPVALVDAGAIATLAPRAAAVPSATDPIPSTQPQSETKPLLETGQTVPCLDQFVEMMVDWGYATEDELALLSRADLEQLIVRQTEQAGITVDELCRTLNYSDNVIEA